MFNKYVCKNELDVNVYLQGEGEGFEADPCKPCTHELDENVYLQGEGGGFEADPCKPCTIELDVNVYLQGEGEGFEAEFLWFYEGRNGWWAYDQRTSIEIENHQKVNTTFVF